MLGREPRTQPGARLVGPVRIGEIAAWLPPRGLPGPPAPAAGALVVEYHHPYRASRMNGVSLHGRVEPEAGAQAALASAIEQRYGVRPAGGALLRLRPERITSWLGFDVSTRPYPDAPEEVGGTEATSVDDNA